ncbi:MAG: SAM-dependent methyltransferase, partial [Henriciella sp.]
LFLGCLFGAGTLAELRTSLLEAETELTGGATPRLSPLPGLQDMAGLLQRTGFALPVVDVEPVTVRYGDPLKLLADLKGMGEQAAFAVGDRAGRKPLTRRLLARMAEIYAERFADPDGRLRATFNVIWLSGWAPDASQPRPLRPGSAKHSLADAVKRAKKP